MSGPGRKITKATMDRMIEISIPGKPIAKARPRFARRGKFVTTYNEQESEESKVMAQILAKLGKDWVPIEEPVALEIIFHFPYLKGHYGSGRNSHRLKPGVPHYHSSKPDLDNLLKFYCDAMNEIVFKDDNRVVKISAFKLWAEDPKTIIKITKLTEGANA